MVLSKVLYGIFLDRCSLSRLNGWVDLEGRVYFYFTISDVMELLSISNKTAVGLFKELVKYELLEVVRQGCNLPNILYLGQYELYT